MIRFKDKVFEQYSICPATGDIFDSKTGVVQKIYMHQGRPVFKRMGIHCIMAHTFYGYKQGYDVHHKDENKLNNALSNLVYLTKAEHSRLHATELLHKETRAKIASANKGKYVSEETRIKISAALKGKQGYWKGKQGYLKGKHLSVESKAKMSAAHKGKKLSEETKAKIRAAALRRGSNRKFL